MLCSMKGEYNLFLLQRNTIYTKEMASNERKYSKPHGWPSERASQWSSLPAAAQARILELLGETPSWLHDQLGMSESLAIDSDNRSKLVKKTYGKKRPKQDDYWDVKPPLPKFDDEDDDQNFGGPGLTA